MYDLLRVIQIVDCRVVAIERPVARSRIASQVNRLARTCARAVERESERTRDMVGSKVDEGRLAWISRA